MHIIQPSETLRRADRSAGEVIKSIADVVPRAIRLATENDIWRGVNNGIEFLILANQLGVEWQQQLRFEDQLLRALQYALLQFAIQGFELPRLAVQLGEYSHFRAQQFWHNRNGDVVHCSVFVSLKLIKIGEVHSRDKNDCRSLKPWMLANHGRQLKTVEFGHAYIHQHYRNVGF